MNLNVRASHWMGSKASCVLWLTGGGVALASHEQEAGSSAQLQARQAGADCCCPHPGTAEQQGPHPGSLASGLPKQKTWTYPR